VAVKAALDNLALQETLVAVLVLNGLLLPVRSTLEAVEVEAQLRGRVEVA
jgi:hypothetical protein